MEIGEKLKRLNHPKMIILKSRKKSEFKQEGDWRIDPPLLGR